MASGDNFIDSGQCTVFTRNAYSTTGSGSLSRSDIFTATPAEIQDSYRDSSSGDFKEMTAYLTHSVEMQMCGVQRNGFYDWIMSSAQPGGVSRRGGSLVDVKRVKGGPSLIQPFFLGKQESVVNDEDWTISNGWRTAGSGNAPYSDAGTTYTASSTGPLASLSGGDRVIRVAPKYSIAVDEDYFLPGHKIVIIGRSGGTAKISVYRVVSATEEAATPPTYVDVLLAGETFDESAAHFDANPTVGLVRLLPNNVQNVEAYCRNRVNVINTKRVPFWHQWSRWSRSVGSEFVKTRNALLRDNKYFAEFFDLPESERARQDEAKRQREFVNAFLFQEPISSNQTIALWENLSTVSSATGATVDPGTGSQLIGYKAAAVGVIPQLRDCGQVDDYQNAPLNIKTWLETEIDNVIRARETGGKQVKTVVVYTDTVTAMQVETAFVAYYKDAFSNINQNINIESGEKYGFGFRRFRLRKTPGIELEIVTHRCFDDLVNGVGTDIASAGKFLMTLDLGTGGSLYPVILDSMTKTHVVGNINDLGAIDTTFSCIMDNPTITRNLVSENWSVVVECPLRSHVAHNFSSVTFEA